MSSSKPSSADLHSGPGFRVRLQTERPDATVVVGLRDFPTPDISDQLNRLYAVNPEIKCMTGSADLLCGSVCTVRVFPGDNLMVHKSLDVAKPGDIVIVNSSGPLGNAVLGDLVCAKAKHRGIAGFIVDGLIRDLPAILELEIPVFAIGTTVIGPLHRGPGEINYPIACGGIVVNPGDIVVADRAGIVIVPREISADLLERLQTQAEAMTSYLDSVRRGEFSNEWVDRLLDAEGCVFHET